VIGFSFSQQASKHGHDDDIGIDDDDRDSVMRDSDESSAVGDMVWQPRALWGFGDGLRLVQSACLA
jgi:hypothetical protein